MDVSIKIPCTLVPVRKFNLLLPNSAIAEVIVSSALELPTNAPQWLYGIVKWQEYNVHVIEFDKIDLAQNIPNNKKSIILVLRNPSPTNKVPYIGILAKSIPQVIDVNSRNIDKNLHPQITHSHAKSYVIVNKKDGVIPNVESLANLIKLASISP
ncbi:MAG: chemotaxis protein CheW [Gammaproteobacteria bacterium]|nr:chemotaxis protein CheW [Gammaproteobacteria bacterium]